MSEKVTDIQARHDAAGDGRRMDIGEGWQAHDDRGELLDMVKRLSEPADAAAWRSGPEWPDDRSAKLAAIEAYVGTFRSRDDADAAFCVALEWATAEIREADERARFANDDRMRAIRELGTTRRCAHGADQEIAEASDALVALGIPEDGRPLAERIRALAPAPAPQTIDDPLYVPAAGCDGCGNDPGQRHAVDCQPLSLAWLGGTREATIAKLPADIAALVRDDAPLTPSERAELVERASPATRAFLAAVKAGATVADLETVLRAYAAEDRERKAWAAVAPPPEPDIERGEPSDIWPIDAFVYCKACHKSHAAQAGDKMCGGPGSWIQE